MSPTDLEPKSETQSLKGCWLKKGEELFQMNIGQSLKEIRLSNRITVSELSRRSSVAPDTIRLIEVGRGTITSLNKLLEALQYEIWWDRKYDDMEVGPALARFRKAAKRCDAFGHFLVI